MTPTVSRDLGGGMVPGARCPRAAPRATWYKGIRNKAQDTKLVGLGNKASLRGSNTPEGQRPGEFTNLRSS